MPSWVKVARNGLVLIALCGVLVFGVSWGLEAVKNAPTGPVVKCEMTDVGDTLEPVEVSFIVVNAGAADGEARRLDTDLRSYKFHNYAQASNSEEKSLDPITLIGNSPDSPEVQLLAQFFKDPVIKGDGRESHIVEIQLGKGWDFKKDYIQNPPTQSISVSGPVCLPKVKLDLSSSSSATP
ncbi:MAG: LytR C-terminal domain-containing protein [Propionibacteriaceae bacterium]|jgi:hypothetical protein|nr:LytR C-terminal domain-containing protein [Propionibacteriaceae bacterium]